MRLQSHHYSDEGLKPYMSSREPEKLDMMNKLVEQFHNMEPKAILLKVSAISNHTSFQPVNNTSMEISMKPEQFMFLLQNGALANLNIKINLTN
ncbi:hypothetical protein C1646_822712 [Rhizophagus diaphanus]|nr:hypothetical protein C1646_822712 [Rhizophagus diaphanus] [Rhizophagus sp. MUCL 43196]